MHTPPCFQAFVLFAVGAGRARCWLPSHPGEVAICQRPSGPLPPPSTLNKPCSSSTSPWSGCARLCSSRCTLASSLQPHYTPVPSPAADDTCMRTGQGPFQGRSNRLAARIDLFTTYGLSPSRTARRGAEGTEAGNFQGGGPLSGFSPGCQKTRDKKRRSFRTTRSKHVISIKIRRSRWR